MVRHTAPAHVLTVRYPGTGREAKHRCLPLALRLPSGRTCTCVHVDAFGCVRVSWGVCACALGIDHTGCLRMCLPAWAGDLATRSLRCLPHGLMAHDPLAHLP